jgi:hypothetical protein
MAKKVNGDSTLTPKMQLIMKGLCEPFPPEKIKKRKGRSGQWWDYVEASEVINRFNEVLGCAWSVTEEESLVISNSVVKRVRIEIPDPDNPDRSYVRDGWASHPVGNDPGDCMKSAFSKALTKAASLFGVGLHLWGVSSENAGGVDEGDMPPWEGPSQFGSVPEMTVNVVNQGQHNQPPQGVQSFPMTPPPQMNNPHMGGANPGTMPPPGPPVNQAPVGPVPQMSNPNPNPQMGYTSGPGTPAVAQMPLQSMPPQGQGFPQGQFASQQQMAPPMGQINPGVVSGGIVAHQVAAIRGATTMAFGPNADQLMLVRQVLGAEAQGITAVEELTHDQAVRVLEFIKQNVQGVQ